VRNPLSEVLRQPHLIVWDSGSDLVTHKVVGDRENVYAVRAGNTIFSLLHLILLSQI
jgi:hypothetical protein